MKGIRLPLVLAVLVVNLYLFLRDSDTVRINEIQINVPVLAYFPLDPRKIYSIGDQVVSEHIFGYHVRVSEFDGFQPYLSNVSIDTEQKSIHIQPRGRIRDSNGNELSLEKICKSLADSFSGTNHAQYPNIFKGYVCDETKAEIYLNYVPVNLKYLLTLPDFAIFDSAILPIKGDRPVPSTGPYYLESRLSDDSIVLRRNKFFPEELRGNNVDSVTFKPYDPSKINGWDPGKNHLIYIMSLYANNDHVSSLKGAGYNVKIFPTEGILFLNFSERVSESQRAEISALMDEIRPAVANHNEYLLEAFSMQPPDRGFGLTRDLYQPMVAGVPMRPESSERRKLVFGTNEKFYDVPMMKGIIEFLLNKMPNELELRVYKKGEFERFDKEVDVNLEVIGLSQADPLSHLYYLKNYLPMFRKHLSDEMLAEIAREGDAEKFSRKVLELDSYLISKRVYVPIIHYPGIVAESPLLERVPSLSWSWGTAAWTYRVR